MTHPAKATTEERRLPECGGAKWYRHPVNARFSAISRQKLVLEGHRKYERGRRMGQG